MSDKANPEVAIADAYRCGYEDGETLSRKTIPSVVAKIIGLIDSEMPEDTLLITGLSRPCTVLGLLDVVKDHYMQAARGETE